MLFSHIVAADELEVDIMELVEKGILALAIAALSSHNSDVWAMGAKLLRDAGYHLEKSR